MTKRHGLALSSLLFALGMMGSAGMTSGQCTQGAINCANHATLPQRTCSASVVCAGFPATSTGFIMVTASNNVQSCTPSSLTFQTGVNPTFIVRAVAATTAPSTRSCSWFWSSASGSTSGNFSITEADGLPVELMRFSIDEPAGVTVDHKPNEALRPDALKED